MPSGIVLGCIIEGGEVTRGMTVTVVTSEGPVHQGIVVSLRHQRDDLDSVRYGGRYGEFGLLIEPAYAGPIPAQVTG